MKLRSHLRLAAAAEQLAPAQQVAEQDKLSLEGLLAVEADRTSRFSEPQQVPASLGAL